MEDNDEGFTQEFEFDNGMNLIVKQRSSIKEGGGTIWDAAYVLIHFFMKHPKGLQDFMVLEPQKSYTMVELGSGTGIAGLAFAKLFPNSTHYLTEYSLSSLKLIDENIDLNKLNKDLVKSCTLEWGVEQAKQLKQDLKIGKENHKDIDIIIGSDIVYLAKQFDDLLQCILELGTQNHTRVIFGATEHGNYGLFQKKLEEYQDKIKITYVSLDYLDDQFMAEDIKVFIMDLI
ncbi:UNKNOWN [Stylonychia lemnae]|uniref:Uncharacterized protein n=1 Tax=Stylonychia lemnae TaxID=5949 RepID=A0A077ZUF7_STYLE|nr:UNKNOWN [Stylonychia lemnae]|eukprot:CDW73507.1 UNKNOWN [Stylonychia lemnae]